MSEPINLKPVVEYGETQLLAAGIIDEIAAVARQHHVTVSITVIPYDAGDED
jgi:hypothetical protein